MKQAQSKRRPPAYATSNMEAQVPAPSASAQERTPPPQRRGDLPPPTGRDPFPYIVAALIGLMIIGLAVVAFLVGSITSEPQAGSLLRQVGPGSGSGFGTSGTSTNPSGSSGGQAGTPLDQSKPGNIGTASGTASPADGGNTLPGATVPDEGQEHVPDGQAITYKNYPPSSGTHYASTADYGFSEKEIPEGKLVHNLEHGAIVLYYKPDLPSAVLQSLRDAATRLPTEKYGKVKIVIAPYPRLQTNLAIAAWGRVETMESFDYSRIRTFYEALVDHGPEDVP